MFKDLAYDRQARGASPGILAQCVLWLLTVAVIVAALYAQRPPAALGADAPATQFSADRALRQLRTFAQHPHPVGSADHAQVRDTLVRAFTALGAKVHVETGTGVFDAGHRRIAAGTVHNIVATLPGTDNQRVVMLTAHYDSVPYGPGAADDGAGVVSILETLRAVRAGPPLRNDVRVVITDGEEAGLLGASAYVAAHPQLAQHVGVVLNFEARGSSGPVMMFETSPDNGWLIRQLAQAAPYPVASSLMYTAYQHMPNDTDLTVFKRAGLQGMNFALVGTFQDYHTALDTVANLAPDTLQHMGSYALALTRHFGNAAFPTERSADQVYFNVPGGVLVHYSLWLVWVLLALAGLLWLVVGRVAVLRADLKFVSFLIGFAGFFLLVLAVFVSVSVVWWGLDAWFGERLLFGDAHSNEWLVAGLVLVGVAAALGLQRGLLARRGNVTRSVGSLFAFGLVTVALSLSLPGASFLLEWPLVIGLAGLWLALLTRRANMAALWVWLGAVPVLVLFAPLLHDLLVMLGMNWTAVIGVAVVLGLACTAASPLLTSLARGARLAVPLLLVGALGCLLAGVSLSHFSARQPQRSSLYYSIDADQGKAAWVSFDARPNASTARVLGTQPGHAAAPGFTLGSDAPAMTHSAPLLPLAPPLATLRAESVEDGVRTLDLHFDSPRGAPLLKLQLAPQTRLLSLAWNGQAPLQLEADKAAGGPWQLSYAAMPPTGVDLQLRLAGTEPLTCRVADASHGLPRLAGDGYEGGDNVVIAAGDAVMVSKRCAWQKAVPADARTGTL